MNNTWQGNRQSKSGFTLVELLVSLAVISMIMVAVVGLLNVASSSYKKVSGKLDAFDAARTGFDTLTRTMRQAALLSYLGYDDPKAPTKYELKSDLQFICGSQADLQINKGMPTSTSIFFQAPTGLASDPDLRMNNALLNVNGFFLGYGDDPSQPSVINGKVPKRPRVRLFQYIQPRENMTLYERTITLLNGIPASNDTYKDTDWFKGDVNAGNNNHILAENVVALAILPMIDNKPANNYLWNSRDRAKTDTHHRLPQALKVVMAVIDEPSAIRLESAGAPQDAADLVPSNLFTDTSSFDDDVKALDQALSTHSPQLNYRIFTADIPLSPANTNL